MRKSYLVSWGVWVQYRRLAKVMHPDSGGSEAAFTALTKNYNACLRAMKV